MLLDIFNKQKLELRIFLLPSDPWIETKIFKNILSENFYMLEAI